MAVPLSGSRQRRPSSSSRRSRVRPRRCACSGDPAEASASAAAAAGAAGAAGASAPASAGGCEPLLRWRRRLLLDAATARCASSLCCCWDCSVSALARAVVGSGSSQRCTKPCATSCLAVTRIRRRWSCWSRRRSALALCAKMGGLTAVARSARSVARASSPTPDIFGGSRRPVEALEACSDATRVRAL